LAMISRNCFQFNLNISFQWSSKSIGLFCSISIYINFILNIFNMFFSTNPCWSCSQMREIIWIYFILSFMSQHIKFFIVFNRRLAMMDCFIKMVMNYFSQVY
jgi:hypothetical protein